LASKITLNKVAKYHTIVIKNQTKHNSKISHNCNQKSN